MTPTPLAITDIAITIDNDVADRTVAVVVDTYRTGGGTDTGTGDGAGCEDGKDDEIVFVDDDVDDVQKEKITLTAAEIINERLLATKLFKCRLEEKNQIKKRQLADDMDAMSLAETTTPPSPPKCLQSEDDEEDELNREQEDMERRMWTVNNNNKLLVVGKTMNGSSRTGTTTTMDDDGMLGCTTIKALQKRKEEKKGK